MSKSKENTSGEKFKSKIGGQAVIEGVMMRGIDKAAMACRLPSGEIDLEEWAIKGGKNAPFYRKIPFVRGVFVFITSMIDGYKCLSRSADKQMSAEQDDDEEPSKFEKWVDEKLGDKLMPIITTVSIILGLALAIALFMLLPSGISKLIDKFIVSLSPIAKNIIEGIIKIAIFIGYTSLTALMKDIRRRADGGERQKALPFSPALRNELYFPCAVHKHFCQHGLPRFVGEYLCQGACKDSAAADRYGHILRAYQACGQVRQHRYESHFCTRAVDTAHNHARARR